MFRTLESNWDQSARRGRATIASFAMQVLVVSSLLAISFLTLQGPPPLSWFEASPILVPAPDSHTGRPRPMRSSNSGSERLQQPPTIPTTIGQFDRQPVAASPDIDGIGVEASTGSRGLGAWDSTGTAIDVAPQVATPAVAARPLKVSHWAEGNLIFRVQPIYPPLARQARVQGSVLLRAVVSKAGTIENLVVMSGHPMLVKSAMEAVRQWRYRPYRLNNDPVEVETEITVNFVLAGG